MREKQNVYEVFFPLFIIFYYILLYFDPQNYILLYLDPQSFFDLEILSIFFRILEFSKANKLHIC